MGRLVKQPHGGAIYLCDKGETSNRIVLRVDVLSTRRCECCGQRSAYTILQEYDDDGNENLGHQAEP